jgi:hypothetical protein
MEEKVDQILLANFKEGDWQEARKQLLLLFSVSKQRELLLAFADYSDYRNDKSQYIARYMIDDFLEANNCC